MSKYNKDYLALQNLWNVCALRYLGSDSAEQRMFIVEDFHDTLIDIKSEGVKAIRSKYEEWENNEWTALCESRLNLWKIYNPFESRDAQNVEREYHAIRCDLNYLRYRKIMQLIQDSGIGLGQGKEVKTVDRKGYSNG